MIQARWILIPGLFRNTYTYGPSPCNGSIPGSVHSVSTYQEEANGPSPEHLNMQIGHGCSTRFLTHISATGWLTAQETRALLATMQRPTAQGRIAISIAGEIGYPVVVKLTSHTIMHKAEFSEVRLNLLKDKAILEVFEVIRTRLVRDDKLDAMEGVLVQPMISGGVEVMADMTCNPPFAPPLAFGLGEIHVEILGDVRFPSPR